MDSTISTMPTAIISISPYTEGKNTMLSASSSVAQEEIIAAHHCAKPNARRFRARRMPQMLPTITTMPRTVNKKLIRNAGLISENSPKPGGTDADEQLERVCAGAALQHEGKNVEQAVGGHGDADDMDSTRWLAPGIRSIAMPSTRLAMEENVKLSLISLAAARRGFVVFFIDKASFVAVNADCQRHILPLTEDMPEEKILMRRGQKKAFSAKRPPIFSGYSL